jgi:hypothetical protein
MNARDRITVSNQMAMFVCPLKNRAVEALHMSESGSA